MEENKSGMVAAIDTLGTRIEQLLDDLKFAGYRIENLENELSRACNANKKLEAENEVLSHKLEDVRAFIAAKEEA